MTGNYNLPGGKTICKKFNFVIQNAKTLKTCRPKIKNEQNLN